MKGFVSVLVLFCVFCLAASMDACERRRPLKRAKEVTVKVVKAPFKAIVKARARMEERRTVRRQ